MKKTAFALGMLLGILGPATASASRLLLSTAEQASPDPLLAPTRGVTMDQVKQRFGMPVQIFPAVGEPPITRWVYPQFIVYFERHWVIHSVAVAARRQRENPSAK